MAAPGFYFGDSSNAIAVDASDPNTATPLDTRTFKSPKDAEGGVMTATAYFVPFGGTSITVELWALDVPKNRWFRLQPAGVVCPTDNMTTFASVPMNMLLFARVVGNTGVTRLGVGFLGAGGPGA